MLRQRSSSIVTLAALLALSPVAVIQMRQVAQAQAPAAAPTGIITVRIGSSPSVEGTSQTLAQQFQAKFPNSKIELNQTTSAEALKALEEGRVDLAAMGRPLTPEEKAAGFVQEPIARRKIAVVVGAQNPFPGDLTAEQFAAIYRGEITNWSELGGSNQPIRVIDRTNSDTRQALQPYPVFQAGAFQTGTTGAPIDDASTQAMISQLGNDGISYALLEQVENQPGVKIVTLYGTPPTDPNYPFSQSLSYVYRGATPNPAAQSFLNFVEAPEVQQILAGAAGAAAGAAVSQAPAAAPASPAPVAASPSPAAPAGAGSPAAPTTSPAVTAASPGASPTTVAQAPAADAGAKTGIPPWLWLLSLPLLGGLIWALLKGLGGSDEAEESLQSAAVSRPVATAAIAADRAGENSRIILTPRSATEAYAYWEVPEAHKQRLRKDEGGQNLALRLYDVTGLEFDRHPAHSIEEFECTESDQDLHFALPQTDRDYLVELGYVTYQGRWVKLAKSNSVHVGADGQPGMPPAQAAPPPILPMMPNFSQPENSFTESSFRENSFAENSFAESSFTENSFRDGMPLVDPVNPAAELPVVEPAEREFADLPEVLPEVLPEAPLEPLPELLPELLPEVADSQMAVGAAAQKSRIKRSQIMLLPRSGQDADAEWEVLEHHKEIAKQHGGQNFILRICDVTGVDLEHHAPHSIQQFNCEESDINRTVTVPDNGEYVAEIGYLAKNGRWLRIARSAPVHIPAVEPPFS